MEANPPSAACSRVSGVHLSSLICCLAVVCTPMIIIYLTLDDDIFNWRLEENGPHDSLFKQDELLVIDTDGEVDAAVAILTVLGDPLWSGRLLAITCVRARASASANADMTASNMLKVLKLAGRIEIPIYMGSPMEAIQLAQQTFRNPNKGILNPGTGSGNRNKQNNKLSINDLIKLEVNMSLIRREHAAVYLSNLVQQNTGMVSLLILGPMTNVALAMRLNPDFMLQIKRIIVLGGYVKGPGPGCYHYNNDIDTINSLSRDPESSSFVFRGASMSNFKMTILPIDTIQKSLISKEWMRSKISAKKNMIVNFITAISNNSHGDNWDAHGLFASVVLIQADTVITESYEYYVDIEVSGELTRGVMVIDYYNVTGREPNAEIVFKLNSTVVQTVLLNNF